MVVGEDGKILERMGSNVFGGDRGGKLSYRGGWFEGIEVVGECVGAAVLGIGLGCCGGVGGVSGTGSGCCVGGGGMVVLGGGFGKEVVVVGDEIVLVGLGFGDGR